MFKVCTYNINSIKARKDLILSWLEKRNYDIDVLCFQELKVEEKYFPFEDFKKIGYHCYVNAQKRYNGVSICSKIELENIKKEFGEEFFDQQKRLIAGKIKDITIINVYVPHGDIRGEDKYYYKLDWYNIFLKWLNNHFSPDEKIILCGDFNVAREDIDVYDSSLLKDSIGTMTEERESLEEVLKWGFYDTFREKYPDQQIFTWWDYIGGAIWKNEGMRIDYIFVTKPLLEKLVDVEVDLWPRRRRKPTPSDHAPLIATFDINI
ncbi:MAG: exodeoxyribonuclease III [Aquificae bacterium]|nr:exodeoxyribonuclease III [Aquificota bacterium]